MHPIPDELRWVFWDVDPGQLDADRHRDYILPRILEHGGLAEVQWALRIGGVHSPSDA